MARYKDYIKFLDIDDGNPEGDGFVLFSLFLEASGTDGNYGQVLFPSLTLESTGTIEPKGTVDLPSLSVEGYSGTHGKITLPSLQVEGIRVTSGDGDCLLPKFIIVSDGNDVPQPGGDVLLPNIYITALGGPLLKIYQLCDNENWGL